MTNLVNIEFCHSNNVGDLLKVGLTCSSQKIMIFYYALIKTRYFFWQNFNCIGGVLQEENHFVFMNKENFENNLPNHIEHHGGEAWFFVV